MNIPFDVLSILNGINDIGFGLRLNCGADSEKFRFVYDRILSETKEAKPDALIVLCEPFLVKFLTEGSQDIYHDWAVWYSALKERGAIVKELSQKYHTVFVPLLEAFEAALKIAPEEHWTCDAIHPSHAGHELIKREWLKTVLPVMKEKGLLNKK